MRQYTKQLALKNYQPIPPIIKDYLYITVNYTDYPQLIVITSLIVEGLDALAVSVIPGLWFLSIPAGRIG